MSDQEEILPFIRVSPPTPYSYWLRSNTFMNEGSLMMKYYSSLIPWLLKSFSEILPRSREPRSGRVPQIGFSSGKTPIVLCIRGPWPSLAMYDFSSGCSAGTDNSTRHFCTDCNQHLLCSCPRILVPSCEDVSAFVHCPLTAFFIRFVTLVGISPGVRGIGHFNI